MKKIIEIEINSQDLQLLEKYEQDLNKLTNYVINRRIAWLKRLELEQETKPNEKANIKRANQYRITSFYYFIDGVKYTYERKDFKNESDFKATRKKLKEKGITLFDKKTKRPKSKEEQEINF